MKIIQNAHIDISPGQTVSREDLDVFLLTVPAGATVETIVTRIGADRPWESEKIRVELQAVWTIDTQNREQPPGLIR